MKPWGRLWLLMGALWATSGRHLGHPGGTLEVKMVPKMTRLAPKWTILIFMSGCLVKMIPKMTKMSFRVCARARGSVPEFWFVSFVLKLVIFFMNISTNNEGRHHFHSIKLLCALYSFIIMLYSITVRGFWVISETLTYLTKR